MSLFSRASELPGLSAPLRDCRDNAKGFKRLSEGDIAVIDQADVSRGLAQKLIDAHPAAVINAGQFSTGIIPNFGPQMLLDEGIILVEGVGEEVWNGFKDGKKARLTDEGQLYYGDKMVVAGVVVTTESAEQNFAEAQRSLVDHMEAYFGNSIQFIHSEAPLLIDGLGIPDIGSTIEGRKVLVVSPGMGHRSQMKQLRNFIREFEPAIIGVDGAADTLVELGYKPDLIVGNPAGIGSDALRSGARVVLPADPDGHATGLERIQDLGIAAMTFPAAVDSATDLALLLADYHGAQLIVNAGAPLNLAGIFSGGEQANPSSLISRAKVGTKLVDAQVIGDLYTIRTVGNLAWLWAVLGIFVACAVIVLIAGTTGSGSFSENLIDTWNNIALWFQGLFS
ncbi:Thiamin pyrophosphokinase, catalytic domain-containing protein [Corynebacterium kutscheri]|uniref:Putative membrane-anchored protein n=2 Tax=Corynebacterium kutscheri TaxID=35755 RepID=A0A0F6R1N8_9CORY|nr:putative membrane-anchored protein [Corynebacterium kutscheri]VEH07062.1 Thiamin pyrophosphokinase, catalytic domain-containing protein [Corynebacterium kutscheri]VEH09473.1 Thiamin pyrophosphokinase, catalytic domain-containing protein [Corynebacterium kutscheri]VEH79558.1 Thiamin pyrophosphokinase, catalytic domain-containing protein [Corynebacterium kutscheri]